MTDSSEHAEDASISPELSSNPPLRDSSARNLPRANSASDIRGGSQNASPLRALSHAEPVPEHADDAADADDAMANNGDTLHNQPSAAAAARADNGQGLGTSAAADCTPPSFPPSAQEHDEPVSRVGAQSSKSLFGFLTSGFLDFNKKQRPDASCCERFLSCLCPCCVPAYDPEAETRQRQVWLNDRVMNEEQQHMDNYVRTTKYTVLSFLPKNLYEQLGKAANFYFFVLAIIVSIPGVSPIEPWTNIAPLCFVLAVSAIREAIEDYGRYQDDYSVNTRVAHVIREGELVAVQWQEVVVGDIVKVYEGRRFPADLLMLSSAREAGDCDIETSTLDGETALKKRQSFRLTRHMSTTRELSALRGKVRVEAPNPNLHFFEGLWLELNEDAPTDRQVREREAEREAAISDGVAPPPSLPHATPPAGSGGKEEYDVTRYEKHMVSFDELLMRDTTLMNTPHIFGLVLYTGKQTKIHLNANEPRHKRTTVEIITNYQMYKIFLLLFVICSIFAIIFGLDVNKREDTDWYLLLDVSNSTVADKFKKGVRDWAAFLILYSLMVPISLYVSMELVRVAQSLLINQDLMMYDALSDTRAIVRTAALNEQLGEIDYVFCDKTGTLTENQMSFARCSINGVPYGVDPNRRSSRRGSNPDPRFLRAQGGLRRGNSLLFPECRLVDDMLFQAIEDQDPHVDEFFTCLGLCHTVTITTRHEEELRVMTEDLDHARAIQATLRRRSSRGDIMAMMHQGSGTMTPRRGSGNNLTSPRGSIKDQAKAMEQRIESRLAASSPANHSLPGSDEPAPFNLDGSGGVRSPASPRSPGSPRSPRSVSKSRGSRASATNDHANSNSRSGSLSRTNRDYTLGDVSYQASSPDEMALVVAARVFGYFFNQRERDAMYLSHPFRRRLRYEVLHVLPFTSERKRMSVIVRSPLDGQIRIYTKGADSVILGRRDMDASVNSPEMLARNAQHLAEFSRLGLRVMCIGVRVIPEKEYLDWAARYAAASESFGNRQQRMEEVAEDVEHSFKILGSTAIEDKLQDGVADTILRLRQALMKVWILTGDKTETAVNIGKSCKLLTDLSLQYASTGCSLSALPGRPKRDSVFSLDQALASPAVQQAVGSTLLALHQESQMRHDSDSDSDSGADDDDDGGDESDYEVRRGTPKSVSKTPAKSGRRSKRQLSVNTGEEVEESTAGKASLRLMRPLSTTEAYALKVAEAKQSDDQREVDIGKNLTRIAELFEQRQLAHEERMLQLKKGRKRIDVDVDNESEEERAARLGGALIVDGPTLDYALRPDNVQRFLDVVKHEQCRVVVCARLAPKQKAAVVELIKEDTGKNTLAIGDGANDVPMILAAHVGVGISGQEGMEASNASDFAIAQFRFLGRLLLVHGRWSYTRNTMLILYSFYKNFAISWTQLWFTLHVAFSDQEIFDGILLNSFNMFWTSLPILFLATFDRDLEPVDLMAYPEVYRDRDAFTVRRFWLWTGMGILHSLFVFFLPFYMLNTTFDNNSFWSMSIATYTFLVMTVTAKLIVMHNSILWPNVGVIALSVGAWWMVAYLYTSEPLFDFAPHAHNTMAQATQEPIFWFSLVLAMFLAIMPDLLYRYIMRRFFPTGTVIIQERAFSGMEMPERPGTKSKQLRVRSSRRSTAPSPDRHSMRERRDSEPERGAIGPSRPAAGGGVSVSSSADVSDPPLPGVSPA